MGANLRKDGFVVAIDFQEKLMPAMHQEKELIETEGKLLKGAMALEMPVIVTTQYAKGLGETVKPLAEILGNIKAVDKTSFSCLGNDEFVEQVEKLGRKTAIITGAEAHICVLQTALDFLEKGYEVQVVVDCIDSRSPFNKEIAIRRLERAGAIITTFETVLYEAAKGAKEPGFKEISAIVK